MATLERLVDRSAIRDLVFRYAQGVDRRDWAMVRSCFDPDGYVQGIAFGAAVGEYLPQLEAGVEAWERTTHFIGNQLVNFDGDWAQAESYAVARHFDNQDPAVADFVIGVRYLDELRRLDDNWVITRRVVQQDWRRDES